jgi:hypothetical protein
MVKEKGLNQLDRILMKVCDDINNKREVLNWLMTNFDLITDINFLPEIHYRYSREILKSNM